MTEYSRRKYLRAAVVVSMGPALARRAAAGTEQETSFDGGDGSEDDPYQISSVDQLQAIAKDLDAHYVLRDDIDASSITSFEPIGNGQEEELFTGSFDGNGFEIRGATVDEPDLDSVGLFGALNNGTIRNVDVIDAHVEGQNGVGILAGGNVDTVESVRVTGTVVGDRGTGGVIGGNDGKIVRSSAAIDIEGDQNVGGIAGMNGTGQTPLAGTVTECRATGSVRATGSQGITPTGGIAGTNDNESTIERSYSEASVTGDSEVGGVAGTSEGNSRIEATFAVGSVEGETSVGGIVGFHGDGTIVDAYWDRDATGQDTSAGVTDDNGLVTEQMTGDSATEHLEGFDFEEVWTTIDTYPRLRWELERYTDDDGIVATDRLLAAFADWQRGTLDSGVLIDLFGVWQSGDTVV